MIMFFVREIADVSIYGVHYLGTFVKTTLFYISLVLSPLCKYGIKSLKYLLLAI
jgi:hypothetical protein